VLQIALPVLCTLFVWWFSTGLVLYLVTLPQRTYRWSLLGATATLCVALWGLSSSAMDATANGAYAAFCCAIAVWGWQEICFLTGVAMGPRTQPCPPGLRGFSRVGAAIQVILFHELQLLALGAAVALVTLDGPNRVGLWTYLILWTMRLSAKLNLFLGVPFLHDDWLPAHLRYLRSYFKVRPMNLLFPVAVSAATIVAFVLVHAALGADATPADATGRLLLASLLALAVLEHWFMVLPLPVAALWSKFRARQAVPRHSSKKPTAVVFPTPTANGG
jgi:putative photosynthetic complex assembly protein 2